jgi:hypothetical protein
MQLNNIPAISPPPRSLRIFRYDGLLVSKSRLFFGDSSSEKLSSLAASTTLTCNVCSPLRLPCVVCITEFGLLTSMTLPLPSMGCMLAAVCITDCWLGCMTLCTCKSDSQKAALVAYGTGSCTEGWTNPYLCLGVRRQS